MGQMHNEPILRRQPGSDKSDIPQQSGCGREKVPMSLESISLSIARALRHNCRYKTWVGLNNETSHCVPIQLDSNLVWTPTADMKLLSTPNIWHRNQGCIPTKPRKCRLTRSRMSHGDCR